MAAVFWSCWTRKRRPHGNKSALFYTVMDSPLTGLSVSGCTTQSGLSWTVGKGAQLG
ncbi:uncharacterized protein LAESUDRAFT_728184 [Laetiporus sulphureus 93-53]|uniref:Uncharacterized protein n=1 Tax=Laetiporus sulphureus 93-53 TaxID=1314785 RepID=A0A165D8S8_9APHY|nr:uncharacterized protein LAESUDRAFT_728184 [Laetiporus sulphureus 93-53]KZT04350.1 hypothetical protein LAESUDRAFT_728184 [Laetiporus sulphureus 93-53]